MTLTADTKLKAVFAYLVLCAGSARGIPVMKPWGIDFHNLHVYQFCSGTHNPYLIAGRVCGDVFQRDLVYPPLLFHAFFWTRKLPMEEAMLYWSSANLFMLAFSYPYWARLAGVRLNWQVVLFSGLLVLQYPMLFLLERGGTDVVSVFVWTLASWCLCRRQLLLAGVFGGLATAYKLYPGIPVAIVTYALLAGSFRNGTFERAEFLRFGLAAAITFAGINALYWNEAVSYFTLVLPKFAATLTPINACMHALGSLAGADHPLYPKLVQLGFFCLWCWSASRSIYDRPALTLAALLAMSTYFAATSWDYNLVTVYPLLVMLFVQARRSDRWGTLLFGLFAIVGDRELWLTGWLNLFNPHMHTALQFAWLVVVAIELAQPARPRPAPQPA